MNKETSAKGKWDGPLDESGNPVFEGHGTFVWENGDKYSGQWKMGQFHGKGQLFYIDGDEYEGEWKDGMYHGHGTLSSPGGFRYVGE